MLKIALPNLVGDNKVEKTDGGGGGRMIKKLATNKIIKKLFKSKNLDKIFEKTDKIENYKRFSFLTSKTRLVFT